jgi:hypothetical protein
MQTVSFVLAYLFLGFLASVLLRKGPPEDLGEGVLASLIALPLVIALAVATLADYARMLLMNGRSGPTAQA